MKERSLLVFTLLAQTSFGAFLTLVLVTIFLAARLGSTPGDWFAARQFTRMPLLLISPLAMIALLASFFHLGRPAHAWRALTNLRTSWLSREILFASLFTLGGGLLAGLWTISDGYYILAISLALVLAIIGLALIYSMARVYMLRTTPEWNTPVTLVSFCLTTLLLGTLFVLASLSWSYAWSWAQQRAETQPVSEDLLSGLAGVAFLAVMIDLIWLLISSGARRRQSQSTGVRPDGSGWRVLLDGSTAFLLLLFLSQAGRLAWHWSLMLTGLALGLAFAAQVLGRLLFYEKRRPYLLRPIR